MAQGFRTLGRLGHPDPAKHYPAKPKAPAPVSAESEITRLVQRITRLDREFRNACWRAPIDEDPLYPIVRELWPTGAQWMDIAAVYGLSKQAVFRAWEEGRARFARDPGMRPFVSMLTEDRGHTAWDEAFLLAEAS